MVLPNTRKRQYAPSAIMLIRDVARATGLSTHVVRRLTERGVIPAKRTPGKHAMGAGASYRVYDPRDIAQFIAKYRKHGVPGKPKMTRLRPNTSVLAG